MYPFRFHRPDTAKAALSLRQEMPDAEFLAGGQSFVQAMKLRLVSPSDLIDLGAIKPLAGIKVLNGSVHIGAMTRHADVAASADVKSAIPALSALVSTIGDRQVRNMGTIGGSLANSDPAADYPAAVLGLGATVVTDRRKIDGDQFFTGLYQTALVPGELISSVDLPVPQRAAYMKFKHPASRFAIVGVFVADFGGLVRVGVTGAGSFPFREAEMEKALTARFAPDSVAGIKVPADRLNDDIHASAAYRANLVNVMCKRAVEAALGDDRRRATKRSLPPLRSTVTPPHS